MHEERLLDTEEVARYLGVHLKTVMKLIESKQVKASKVGRVWRLRKRDVGFTDRQPGQILARCCRGEWHRAIDQGDTKNRGGACHGPAMPRFTHRSIILRDHPEI